MALQAVVEDHGGDDRDDPVTKLTLKTKRSRRDVKRAQPEPHQGNVGEEEDGHPAETAIATVSSADPVNGAGEMAPPKSGSKTIHRVRSNTVWATITTVIKMEEGGHGHHHRRASVDSRVKHGEARSRVSLVPELDDQLDLSVVAGEDDEYMSAGDGEDETGGSIIEDSDSLREMTDSKGTAREVDTPDSRIVA